MLEGVRFIKEYIQHSRHRAVVINRQDEQGVCCKLPANCRFNPPIGLDILDTQNLAARRIMPRDRQCGHHMLPYISRATTASSPVNQLISLQKTDSDSSGVGNVSRTHSDQIHSAIDVEFVRRNCPLEFDNGRERLSIQFTVLHCKCLGQKHLEGLGIEVVGSQSRLRSDLRLHCWVVGSGGRAVRTSAGTASRSFPSIQSTVNSNAPKRTAVARGAEQSVCITGWMAEKRTWRSSPDATSPSQKQFFNESDGVLPLAKRVLRERSGRLPSDRASSPPGGGETET